MGKRTSDLPELTGIAHTIREIRYNEFSRQAIGILLIAVFCGLGRTAARPVLDWRHRGHCRHPVPVVGVRFRH